ncbi:hypothetical protein F4821DRAFT_257161 [Hypoxylon rubiginosum]|uniref:Uncharacterized protein n=1 Tax=Hypoxylon rubiginosum TaxID=110542 RepID=A0ACC0D9Y6_9PEZI|nr:hypothetical protein F4821DRAFT_257161 [Hypoxylon rubiginosum]
MQLLAVLFSLIPAFVVGVQAVTAPNGSAVHSFIDTCDTPDLSPSGKHFLLWAACKTRDRLDLDKCYGDDNGNVVARKDGKLSDHCSGCRLGSGNRALGCVCKEKPDKVTWIVLNDLITNEDGFLQCYDDQHKGSETCGQ